MEDCVKAGLRFFSQTSLDMYWRSKTTYSFFIYWKNVFYQARDQIQLKCEAYIYNLLDLCIHINSPWQKSSPFHLSLTVFRITFRDNVTHREDWRRRHSCYKGFLARSCNCVSEYLNMKNQRWKILRGLWQHHSTKPCQIHTHWAECPDCILDRRKESCAVISGSWWPSNPLLPSKQFHCTILTLKDAFIQCINTAYVVSVPY